MKQVLYIGCYDKTGRFTSHNWKVFLDFLKERGTKIEILVTHSNDKIKNVVEVTEISNSELLMYTIKVNEQSIKMLLSLNYDIDLSGIEYMFFYDNDGELACLNITDYENYVVIDEKINTDGLILRGISIDDNCFDWVIYVSESKRVYLGDWMSLSIAGDTIEDFLNNIFNTKSQLKEIYINDD